MERRAGRVRAPFPDSRHSGMTSVDESMSRSDRRGANVRTGLMLAAVALVFFVVVIVKYKVFGP